jgi:broad specificity phosphatase PhoE
MVQFIFLRHGEAKHNKAFHEENQNEQSVFTNEEFRDAPLTLLGIQQARTVGEKLVKEFGMDGWTAIWCSPLNRAIETACEIYEEINVHQAVLHDNLIEMQIEKNVCNHRLTRDEIKKKYFSMWDTKYLADVQPVWNRSENPTTVRYRMWMLCAFLSELYKDKPDPRILIVSHANAIQELTGKYLKNCEYCVINGLDGLSLVG